MKTVCASFEIVTPMFIGSSDPTKPEGVRSSSVKGALRFWWRALNWARMSGASDAEKLRNLHQEESRLFGVSAGEKSGGQGIFLLQVRHGHLQGKVRPFGERPDFGIGYLLGQGMEVEVKNEKGERKKIPREALNEKQKFEVAVLFRPKNKGQEDDSKKDIESVVEVLKTFGLLGALGSRARHGMGSVAMTAMTSTGLDVPPWQAPTTPEAYLQQLQQLLAPTRSATGLPPLSAFSEHTRVDVSCQHKDMKKLLDMVGNHQRTYRSFQSSECNFKDDHDLLRNAASGQYYDRAPRRIIFGLPHNYYFSSVYKEEFSRLIAEWKDEGAAKKEAKKKAGVDVNCTPRNKSAGEPKKDDGRRASPLLLRVHRVGDQYLAVHTLLKSLFLPEERPTVQIKPGKGKTMNVPIEVDWQVIHNYLNRFENRKTLLWSPL